jgi:hypothetical protein
MPNQSQIMNRSHPGAADHRSPEQEVRPASYIDQRLEKGFSEQFLNGI